MHVAMPTFALLMRCLLIVSLCFDLGVSQRAATVMAASEARQATSADRVAQNDVDCAEDAPQGGNGAPHHYNCDGSACCACAFPVATITHMVPFAARYALANQPALRSILPTALGENARVFRPPIG